MSEHDENDMPMSGDGADVQPVPADENGTDKKKKTRTYEKPLKIKGTFGDALRVLVGKKPKVDKE